jgi:two-component system cell cycle sensor histidine kinase/response regulator CckA
MIVIIIFLFGIIPTSFKVTLFLTFLTYTVYLLPILFFDKITNIRIFINNNIFLTVIFIGGLIWRYINYKLLIKNLSLEYDLSQDKEQLETLVEERAKELSISEKKLRSLFEYATDGIMLLDGTGKILDVNQKASDIYGFSKDALVGSNIELLEADKDKSLSKERMNSILKGESLLFETQHYRKDTSKVYMEITAKAIEVEGNIIIQSFLRDITEKKILQEQLLQSQKMESIGALAGGIAHNFNNLLTTILGNAELLEDYEDLDYNNLKKRVNNIQNSAKKAGMLVSKLLSFARRDTFEIIPLNLNDIINETLLFEGVLGKKIHMKTSLSDTIPTVEGDRNQIEHVIMNLVVNARDAMPNGGFITITTSVIELKKGVVDIPSYAPGEYVLLIVSDTGCGIPREIINRVFDPFFTTKERGKGTGLGLATVYGIINDHKGYVTVQSEGGKGTSFYIYLPVSGKPVHKSRKPKPISVKGNETILVVDDEEDVLDYIKDILETYGYKVMPTNNPLFAIDIFKGLAEEIQLVITDNIMPLMEGKELIKNLKAIKPDIKIVAVSGYSEDGMPKDKTIIDAFIKKPFEGSHLLSTVRSILDTGIRNLPFY